MSLSQDVAMKYGVSYSARYVLNHKCIFTVMAILFLLAAETYSHGAHKSQPIGIIDPLVTHHAILEDELKLNYFNLRNDDEDLTLNTSSLEIAYTFTDYVGFEVFLSFIDIDMNGQNYSGFGDIEAFIPKISFIRKYGFVMTTYVATRIPVGNENKDLGEPGWGFAPHLLMDYGKGSFGMQVNAAVEIETEGDEALEGSVSFAYTFVLKNNNENKFVVSPLVEFSVESPLNGPETKSIATILPGMKIALSGWHLGLGAQLPITDEREFDYNVTVQLGYHIKWENLFK